MKSLMLLMQNVLADASRWCCTSTTQDYNCILRRYKHEGLSFLTITLPSFARDFERSLDNGCVDHAMFLSFSKHRALPKFLGGLLDRVFNRSSGLLLDRPDHTAIFFIRQITMLYKKIALPCSKTRIRRAYDQYIKCEHDLKLWEQRPDITSLLSEFGSVSDLLWSEILSNIDAKVYNGQIIPKHGPGSVADGLIGNEKFKQRTWTRRMEESFLYSSDFLLPNSDYYSELDNIEIIEPDREMPVKVISVPKTQKGPRLIAVEPTCTQYVQQGILELLVSQIDRNPNLFGAINFSDQIPNQESARKCSSDSKSATLDLSEASDRVSFLLVSRLLRNFPHLAGAVSACRSQYAKLPSGEVLPLRKFASMGSALCFPFEAMVFLTIILLAEQRRLSRSLKRSDVNRILQTVRVYGDDLIVPCTLVPFVLQSLKDFSLKVNVDKSFYTGKFRESCGRDYYDGSDVTVTYVRSLFPKTRRSAKEMISTFSLRNQLYKAGCWASCAYLDTILSAFAKVPIVYETSPVLGRHSFLSLPFSECKMHDTLHYPMVKGFVVKPRRRRSSLDGPPALLKYFLKRGVEPIFDVKHLQYYGRPESVDIKTQWAPVY